MPVLLVALAALFVVAGAQAVHDTGAFQLDGDAQKATSPAGTAGTTAPNGDDWDNICASNPTTCTFASGFSASPSTTATASSHNFDGAQTASIFTGGGSKDPQDLNNWKWKDGGGLPDKDNLQHGFAARYSLPSTGANDTTCPSTTSGANACKLLYFGSDRFDNSGDAQEGFWFFQNPVCLKTDGTFGDTVGGTPQAPTCSGTALHTPGDLLILSDFSNGGGTSTINIYKWVASGGDVATNLLSLGGGTSQGCNKTPPLQTNDAFCGAVNPTNGTIAPWTFTDKSGNHTYLNGEFYEGGVNLSSPTINLGGECFASFASETRSSTSPTATLKDFVLGGFGKCTSGTVTTPQTGAGGGITSDGLSIGTGSVTVRDHAVVTVGGAGTFGGNVTFSLCGPLALDSVSNCESGGVQIGDPVPISDPSPVTVNSDDGANDVTTLTSVGRYCWRANYSGDAANNVPASSDPASGDTTSTTECFTVNPVTPTLVTSATGGGAIPATLSDTATLTGTANAPGSDGIGPGGTINATNGAPAGGSIHWTAFGPNNCTTLALADTSRGVSGDGTYPKTAPPDNQAAVSFTTSGVGTFTFVASYTGDSPNTNSVPAVTCANQPSGEQTTTTDTSSVLTDQTWVPNDHAKIASAGGTALSGTAVFTLYDNGTCDGNVLYSNSANPITVSGASPQIVDSSNTTHVNASTTVSWKVVYTSNNSTSGSTSSCESTALTITNNPGYTPLP